jgi:lantibiotic modifying enzyme
VIELATTIGERVLASVGAPDDVRPAAYHAATMRPYNDLSTSGGRSGEALLFLELAHATGEQRWYDAAEAGVLAAARALPTQNGTLYAGLAGFAFVLDRYFRSTGRGSRLRETVKGALRELAAGVFDGRTHPEVRKNVKSELISGVAGFHIAATQLGLADVVERTRPYLEWYVHDVVVPGVAHATAADPVNLGVSHGIAGVLAALALSDSDGSSRSAALTLAGALLDIPLDDPERPWWPHVYEGPGAATWARTAWCYGNPGVAASLALASARYDELRLLQHALLAMQTVRATGRDAWHIYDDAICHGTSGVALCADTVARAAQDTSLAAFAEQLYDEAAAHFDERLRFGYRAELLGKWFDDASLLTGACGIAVAQLARLPGFDRSALRFFALG